MEGLDFLHGMIGCNCTPMNTLLAKSLKQAKKVIVAVVGFTVLLIGVAMIVLPGPALVVVPAGLVILATEFVWARRLLKKARAWITNETPERVNKDGQEDDSKREF
jgi:uncharacterized protein (TIGR02611 family)